MAIQDETRTENGKIVEPDRRQKPPPAEAAPGPQIVNADSARTGPLGAPVLVVLVVSLSAIVVLFALYWGFWSASVP